MNNLLLSKILGGCIFLLACSNPSNSNKIKDNNIDKSTKEEKMNNLVSIIEIPITDYARASTFYQSILGLEIEQVDMGDTLLGVLPSEEGTLSVVLVKGEGYVPTSNGAVIYLNAGEDLQPTLEKIEKNGGTILVPKTEISPEMGYFAIFMDVEGNKLGLHSKN